MAKAEAAATEATATTQTSGTVVLSRWDRLSVFLQRETRSWSGGERAAAYSLSPASGTHILRSVSDALQ